MSVTFYDARCPVWLGSGQAAGPELGKQPNLRAGDAVKKLVGCASRYQQIASLGLGCGQLQYAAVRTFAPEARRKFSLV